MALKTVFYAMVPLLSALAAGLPMGGHAAESDPFGESDHGSRWIPGIGVTGFGLVQERRGSVDSVERGSHRGDSRAVFWSMGLDVDLLSPTLDFLPAAPRLFVHGGAHMSFDREDPVANDDDPGKPVVTSVGPRMPISGVTNLGSATKVETRPLSWAAGAGFAFDVSAGDLRFRVKPSFEWHWQKDRLRSALSSAESVGGNPEECNPCRLLRIDATTTEEYHSIGPGIELEFDGVRLSEDFVLTVFSGVQALAILGETKSSQQTSGTWMTNGVPSGVPDSTVTSEYERDRWNIRFGIGVRIRWLPE